MSTLALTALNTAAKAKTWTHTVNQAKVCADANAKYSAVQFELKTRLLAIAGATVKGSSDGVTAAMDGVDRVLADPGTLTNAPLKWAVVDVPTISGSFEFLFNFGTGRMYLSPTGLFTGGNTTTRPTATDESSLSDSYPSGAATIYTHFMVSSDGKSFMYFVTGSNVVHTHLIVLEGVLCCETASSLDTVWSASWHNALAVAFPGTWNARISGANMVVAPYSGPYYAATADAKTAQGSAHIAHEIGLSDNSNTPDGVIFSSVIDIYRGGVSLAVTGDGAPSGGTREWMHIGQILIPWNGVALTIV